MIDALAKVLSANELDPDSFVPVPDRRDILYAPVLAGAMSKWVAIAKAAKETKYWPLILVGESDGLFSQGHDPAAILSAAPAGDVRQVLEPLIQQRRNSLSHIRQVSLSPTMPDFAESKTLDDLAAMADASGIYSFSGSKNKPSEPWPAEKPTPERIGFNSLKRAKGQSTKLLLIRMEHTYEVPAYLGLGGWNECPAPEIQVAVCREWQKAYKAVPGCITGDVIEFLVSAPPQTEPEAMTLAADQWIYCEDIVGQGTQSIRKLAIEIWKSRTWFFWWD
jgi:hypothetical protein